MLLRVDARVQQPYVRPGRVRAEDLVPIAAPSEHEGGKVACVDVVEPSCRCVVPAAEERRVPVGRRSLVDQAVEVGGASGEIGLAPDGLCSPVAAQHGHQQRRRRALPRDIANCQARRRRGELDKVVVIAAKTLRGAADACVFESRQNAARPRQEPLLHVVGDLDLARASQPLGSVARDLRAEPAVLGGELGKSDGARNAGRSRRDGFVLGRRVDPRAPAPDGEAAARSQFGPGSSRSRSASHHR